MSSPNCTTFILEYLELRKTDPTFTATELATETKLQQIWQTLDQKQLSNYAHPACQKVMQQDDDSDDKLQFISSTEALIRSLMTCPLKQDRTRGRRFRQITSRTFATLALTLQQNPELWQALRQEIMDGRIICDHPYQQRNTQGR